jgi:hypothetical protein
VSEDVVDQYVAHPLEVVVDLDAHQLDLQPQLVELALERPSHHPKRPVT